jgi:hypothetical protein
LIATALGPAPGHAVDVQFPVGSSLGLVPPPGLNLEGTIPGFRDAEHNVSILMLELPPGAFDAIRGSLITDAAKPHGVIIDERETLFTDAGAGLLSVGNDTNGHRRRWMLLAQMPRFTALVTVEVPDEARKLYPDDVIRKALTTLSLRDAPIEEQLGLLPFRLTDLGGFRVVAVVNRNAVILTKGEQDNIHVVDQPHLVIGIGPSGAAPSRDWPRMAEITFNSLPGYVDRQITTSEMIRIDGAPAYEIRALARDAVTGDPVMMVQWVRFGGSAFVQIVGITTQAHWERDFPHFRAVRDGIQPRS